MTAVARTRRAAAAAPALTAEEALILDLTDVLRTRLTKLGHLAMVVPWESRGGCPITGCGPGCIAARGVLAAAATWLEARAAMPAAKTGG